MTLLLNHMATILLKMINPSYNVIFPGCYRIMEAAIEQACCQGVSQTAVPPQSSIPSLSLQQSRQVLAVLEEAFSAIMYYLQQVRRRRLSIFWCHSVFVLS